RGLAKGEYKLQLILEAEHQITTVVPLPEVKVWTDEPPAFGKDETKPGEKVNAPVKKYQPKFQISPEDALKFKFTVEDTVGIDRVEVEYSINGGPVQPGLKVEGEGKTELAVDQGLKLLGKVQDGDNFFYRIKAVDNRNVVKLSALDLNGKKVPKNDLPPHMKYDSWYALRIS